MFFDCQVMTMTSCPGKGTLTAPPTFAIPPNLLKIMKSNPTKDPVMIVQDRVVQVVEFHGKRSKSRKIRIAIILKVCKRKKFAKKISKMFDQSEGWILKFEFRA